MLTTWKLVYSTEKDGISMRTLLQHSEEHQKSPALLLIKPLPSTSYENDKDNSKNYKTSTSPAIIGCYTSEGWKAAKSHYGNGESFLFRQSPVINSGSGSSSSNLSIYPSSGQNDYYQFCDRTFMAIGCTGSSFGLWISADLTKASSEEVSTFYNAPLNGSDTDFEIAELELWSLSYE